MRLTRKEALKLHRQMWGDMKKKCGDYPSHRERHNFKERFITKHFGEDEDFENDCFLCEYALQKYNENLLEEEKEDYLVRDCCLVCPIDWSNGESEAIGFACELSKVKWDESPISEILSLPERNIDE